MANRPFAILDENMKVYDVHFYEETKLPTHKAGRVLPLEDAIPEHDPDEEQLELDTFEVKTDKVTRVYRTVPLPPEVIARIKLLKATLSITTVDGKEKTITLKDVLKLIGF